MTAISFLYRNFFFSCLKWRLKRTKCFFMVRLGAVFLIHTISSSSSSLYINLKAAALKQSKLDKKCTFSHYFSSADEIEETINKSSALALIRLPCARITQYLLQQQTHDDHHCQKFIFTCQLHKVLFSFSCHRNVRERKKMWKHAVSMAKRNCFSNEMWNVSFQCKQRSARRFNLSRFGLGLWIAQ